MAIVYFISDVETAKAAMRNAVQQLTSNAAATGLANTSALYTNIKSLADEADAIDKISTFWGYNFPEIIARANAATALAGQLGGQLAAVTGGSNPVTVAMPKEWSIGDLVFWAALIGGGYLVYKWVIALSPADDVIPRQRLPRYAGGSRR